MYGLSAVYPEVQAKHSGLCFTYHLLLVDHLRRAHSPGRDPPAHQACGARKSSCGATTWSSFANRSKSGAWITGTSNGWSRSFSPALHQTPNDELLEPSTSWPWPTSACIRRRRRSSARPGNCWAERSCQADGQLSISAGTNSSSTPSTLLRRERAHLASG
jgi:hypothetical protein